MDAELIGQFNKDMPPQSLGQITTLLNDEPDGTSVRCIARIASPRAAGNTRLGPALFAEAFRQACLRHARVARRTARSVSHGARLEGESHRPAGQRQVHDRHAVLRAPRGRRGLGAVHLDRFRYDAAGADAFGKREERSSSTIVAWRRTIRSSTGRGPIWRATLIELPNGSRSRRIGTGQRIRGRRRNQYRPTLIVCDDLQNDSHISSALQREASRAMVSRHAAQGGHNADQYRQPGHRACIARRWRWSCTSPRLDVGAFLRHPNVADEHGAVGRMGNDLLRCRQVDRRNRGAGILRAESRRRWTPERWCSGRTVEDLYTLMQMRVESGRTAFEREKQGSPVDPRAVRVARSRISPSTSGSTHGRAI